MEYTLRLGEVFGELEYTKYSTDYVVDSSFKCIINDTSQPEAVEDMYSMNSSFIREGYYFTSDPDDKKIIEIHVYLQDREYTNLLPIMSAIVMTCDPSLDSKSALEVTDLIPLYDTSNAFEDPGPRVTPHYHNGIGYLLEKVSHSSYYLNITLEE